MGKRAAVITSSPRNRDGARIRRATKDDIRGQGIDGAIESYLQSATTPTTDSNPTKR